MTGERPTTNTRMNRDEFRKDNPETIVDRLNGIYPVPGVPGQYKTPPIQQEAAREIGRLRDRVKELEQGGELSRLEWYSLGHPEEKPDHETSLP